MQKTLKTYFIPHAENNYHPRILHGKRTVLYGSTLLLTKGIVFAFTLFLPLQVFMLPDVLAGEKERLIGLADAIRDQNGIPAFAAHAKLDQSAELKSEDMAAYRYFDHTGPDGRNLQYFLSKAGYPFAVAGENLAMGFSDASDVVEAWKKSPTHYANLVDREFSDTGIGIMAGEYQGIPTVYITQHFGREKQEPTPVPAITEKILDVPSILPKKSDMPAATPVKQTAPRVVEQDAPQTDIQGVKEREDVIAAGREGESTGVWATLSRKKNNAVREEKQLPVVFDGTRSFASWQDVQKNKTFVSFTVFMNGSVQSAAAYVDDAVVPLHETDSGVYEGGAGIARSSDELFRVVMFPTVRVSDKAGNVSFFQVPWETVKIVSPTPVEKYTQSKTLAGGMMNIFTVSKTLYAAFFIFFLAALLMNVFVEVRVQHPKVIGQTVGLLGLIVVLFLV